MTRELINRVSLRNTYSVFKEKSTYSVVSENRRGQSYESKISSEAVSYLKDRLHGQRVTTDQAARMLAPKAESLKLPYMYGDKLRYSAQYVLVVLVALRDASVVKEGRSYVYTVKRRGSEGMM